LNGNESSFDALYSDYKAFNVDLAHIMDNLIDHYSFPLEQAAIVENMDNCIDESKYDKIEYFVSENLLKIVMHGTGIPSDIFHNTLPTLAGTTKTDRGGLGHYGWGMKVGLGISDKIVINTKIGSFIGAQEWKLDPKGIPIYRSLENPGLNSDMTIIEHHLNSKYSTSIDCVKVKRTLQEFYPTLLGGAQVLGRKIRVELNNEQVPQMAIAYSKKKPFSMNIDGKKITGYFCYRDKEYPESMEKVSIIVCGRTIFKDTFGINTNKKIAGYIHADILRKEITGDKTTIKRLSSAWKKISTEAGRQLATFLREMGELKEETKWDADFTKQLHQQINDTLKHFPELFKDFRAAPIAKDVLIGDKSGQIPITMTDGAQMVRGTIGGSNTGGGVPTEGNDLNKKAPQRQEMGESNAIKKERKIRQGIQIKQLPSQDQKEAWFDYAEGIVWLNTQFSTYQKAENEGKKVLEYHCARCIFDSLLEYVAKNQWGNNLNEFLNYRTELLSKWCEQ